MAWSFGKRLRHARIELGISQRELAKRALIRQSHLSMLENEHNYPNAGVIRRLVHALGINAGYLLGLTKEMTFIDYEELEPEAEERAAEVALV